MLQKNNMKPHIKVKQFLLNFNVQCDITNLAATKTANFLKKYIARIYFLCIHQILHNICYLVTNSVSEWMTDWHACNFNTIIFSLIWLKRNFFSKKNVKLNKYIKNLYANTMLYSCKIRRMKIEKIKSNWIIFKLLNAISKKKLFW